MAKNKEVQKVSSSSLPAYLQNVEKDDSLTQIAEYRIVPRVKLIQGLSDESLREQFGEGAAIVSPSNVEICGKESSFLFIPVFFFVEYNKWRDRKDPEKPAIALSSYDPTSEVAKKAKDGDLRQEPYDPTKTGPKDKHWRYVEHLTFAGIIYGDHPLANQPVILSFEKGEHGKGRAFCSAIQMRNVNSWCQVWEMSPSLREKEGDKWWGFDFNIPSEEKGGSFIAEEDVERIGQLFADLKDDFENKRLRVDHSDTVDDSDDGETDKM